MNTTTNTTRDQIEALRTNAGAAGDQAQVIAEARSNAAQFQVQIRPVNGGRWTPGVHGTLNQTGQSDAFASSFESEGEACEAAAMVRLEMGDDYEVRVANIG